MIALELMLSTPVAVLKVQVWPPTTLVNTLLTGPVKPLRAKDAPKALVVVSTSGHEPEVTVTAEVSTLKVPFRVALPAPVTLLAAASVTTNFKLPAVSRVSLAPVATVVLVV